VDDKLGFSLHHPPHEIRIDLLAVSAVPDDGKMEGGLERFNPFNILADFPGRFGPNGRPDNEKEYNQNGKKFDSSFLHTILLKFDRGSLYLLSGFSLFGRKRQRDCPYFTGEAPVPPWHGRPAREQNRDCPLKLVNLLWIPK
jgi:hypothetical protein